MPPASTSRCAPLAPFLTDDIVFTAYGDRPVEGREAVLDLWKNILASFAKVQFETVHQAVDGDVVIAGQVHGLALPGGKLAPMNMAVHELRDGKIAAWRDYGTPEYGRALLQA